MAPSTAVVKKGEKHLDTKQTEEVKNVFQLFDMDGSGYIDRRELMDAMQALGLQPTKQEANRIIGVGDKSGEGFMDYPEFLAMMEKKMLSHDPRDDMISCFETLDSDGAGFMTIDGLKKVAADICDPADAEQLEELLNTLTGGTGKMSEEDFLRIMKRCNLC
mmetsp:Transcript_22551/g.57690  ORF Transcript_22551/g.57690 Transcript_22551/m.57690 type:complete len:162 (-) Transcript_22551:112-597(-)